MLKITIFYMAYIDEKGAAFLLDKIKDLNKNISVLDANAQYMKIVASTDRLLYDANNAQYGPDAELSVIRNNEQSTIEWEVEGNSTAIQANSVTISQKDFQRDWVSGTTEASVSRMKMRSILPDLNAAKVHCCAASSGSKMIMAGKDVIAFSTDGQSWTPKDFIPFEGNSVQILDICYSSVLKIFVMLCNEIQIDPFAGEISTPHILYAEEAVIDLTTFNMSAAWIEISIPDEIKSLDARFVEISKEGSSFAVVGYDFEGNSVAGALFTDTGKASDLRFEKAEIPLVSFTDSSGAASQKPVPYLSSICNDGKNYYALSTEGNVYKSDDGVSWVIHSKLPGDTRQANTRNSASIAYSGGLLVAGGTQKDALIFCNSGDNWVVGNIPLFTDKYSEQPVEDSRMLFSVNAVYGEYYALVSNTFEDPEHPFSEIWKSHNGSSWALVKSFRDVDHPENNKDFTNIVVTVKGIILVGYKQDYTFLEIPRSLNIKAISKNEEGVVLTYDECLISISQDALGNLSGSSGMSKYEEQKWYIIDDDYQDAPLLSDDWKPNQSDLGDLKEYQGWYLWIRTTKVYENAALAPSHTYEYSRISKDGEPGPRGEPGVGVLKETVQYCVSESGSIRPSEDANWEDNEPNVELHKGKYCWKRYKREWTGLIDKDNITWEYSCWYIGADGENGASWTESETKYAISSDGNTSPDDPNAWKELDEIDITNHKGSFLWTRMTTSSTKEGVEPIVVYTSSYIGADGRPAKVVNTKYEYVIWSNGQDYPEAEEELKEHPWLTERPDIAERKEDGSYKYAGMFLWTKTITVYESGEEAYTYLPTYISSDGAGVKSIDYDYLLDDQGDIPPDLDDPGWREERDDIVATPGSYIWTRIAITYDDLIDSNTDSVKYSYFATYIPVDGANATLITVSADKTVFQLDSDGNPYSGQEITVSVNKYNIDDDIVLESSPFKAESDSFTVVPQMMGLEPIKVTNEENSYDLASTSEWKGFCSKPELVDGKIRWYGDSSGKYKHVYFYPAILTSYIENKYMFIRYKLNSGTGIHGYQPMISGILYKKDGSGYLNVSPLETASTESDTVSANTDLYVYALIKTPDYTEAIDHFEWRCTPNIASTAGDNSSLYIDIYPEYTITGVDELLALPKLQLMTDAQKLEWLNTYIPIIDAGETWTVGGVATRISDTQIEMKESGWLAQLSLMGVEGDDVATWLSEYIPFFESELPFPRFTEATIKASAGEYSDTLSIVATIRLHVEILASQMSYQLSARGVCKVQQTIVLKAVTTGILGTVTWRITKGTNIEEYTGTTATITVDVNDTYKSIYIVALADGYSDYMTIHAMWDNDNSPKRAVTGVVDGLINLPSTLDNDGVTPLVEGDYILVAVEGKDGNEIKDDAKKYYTPYRYNGTAWEVVDGSEPNASEILFSLMNDALVVPSDVQASASIILAWIKTLVAQDAFIDAVTVGNFLRSANYSEDASGSPTKGWEADTQTGIIKSVQMHTKDMIADNAIINGSLNHSSITTIEESSGSSVSVSFADKTLWSKEDLIERLFCFDETNIDTYHNSMYTSEIKYDNIQYDGFYCKNWTGNPMTNVGYVTYYTTVGANSSTDIFTFKSVSELLSEFRGMVPFDDDPIYLSLYCTGETTSFTVIINDVEYPYIRVNGTTVFKGFLRPSDIITVHAYNSNWFNSRSLSCKVELFHVGYPCFPLTLEPKNTTLPITSWTMVNEETYYKEISWTAPSGHTFVDTAWITFYGYVINNYSNKEILDLYVDGVKIYSDTNKQGNYVGVNYKVAVNPGSVVKLRSNAYWSSYYETYDRMEVYGASCVFGCTTKGKGIYMISDGKADMFIEYYPETVPQGWESTSIVLQSSFPNIKLKGDVLIDELKTAFADKVNKEIVLDASSTITINGVSSNIDRIKITDSLIQYRNASNMEYGSISRFSNMGIYDTLAAYLIPMTKITSIETASVVPKNDMTYQIGSPDSRYSTAYIAEHHVNGWMIRVSSGELIFSYEG